MSRVMVENVPFISQLVKYPTGCESVSAVMVLNWAGVEVTVDEFIDNYLAVGTAPYRDENGELKGCDPWKEFPGDPRTEKGWGCFLPVVVNAVEKMGAGVELVPMRGEPLEKLCHDWIDRGIPLVFWATIHMNPPREYTRWKTSEGKEIVWISPMHCLVLIGYDEEGYWFNDPTDGEKKWFPKSAVEAGYTAQGCQALAILPKRAGSY